MSKSAQHEPRDEVDGPFQSTKVDSDSHMQVNREGREEALPPKDLATPYFLHGRYSMLSDHDNGPGEEESHHHKALSATSDHLTCLEIASLKNYDSDLRTGRQTCFTFRNCNKAISIRQRCLFILRTQWCYRLSIFTQNCSHIRTVTT